MKKLTLIMMSALLVSSLQVKAQTEAPKHIHNGKAILSKAEAKAANSGTNARLHWCSHCKKFWNDKKVDTHVHF